MVVSNVWVFFPDLEKQSNWINIFRWVESTSQMQYIKHIGVCTCHFLYAQVESTMNPFSCFHHDDLHSMPSTFVALSREKKNCRSRPHSQRARQRWQLALILARNPSGWLRVSPPGCVQRKPLNLEDLSCPKDLGPSNGRVWTCIAGIRSSK